ncbi:hypothetical protein E2C01_043978 [Portunus trituberculatus]|uniref:Uncharacterized protein n=1 Tax=Portunus trituberculatus TaxID=210409 RepID=A0A5B7G0Z4_PORTR|nr:hypothetical protein [Portunus trituberculatus]
MAGLRIKIIGRKRKGGHLRAVAIIQRPRGVRCRECPHGEPPQVLPMRVINEGGERQNIAHTIQKQQPEEKQESTASLPYLPQPKV